MYELLYTSVATSNPSRQSILDILDVSRKNNKRLEITGMLLYHNQEFIQLLEGSEKEVIKLFEAIKVDKRHTSVETFYHDPVDKRSFSNWSMAFDDLEENKDLNTLPGFENFDTQGLPMNLISNNPNIGKTLFLHLRKFLE